jgi:hypothetical protein
MIAGRSHFGLGRLSRDRRHGFWSSRHSPLLRAAEKFMLVSLQQPLPIPEVLWNSSVIRH